MRQNCFRVCLMFEIALQTDKARFEKRAFFVPKSVRKIEKSVGRDYLLHKSGGGTVWQINAFGSIGGH